jgi:hypothetical protein
MTPKPERLNITLCDIKNSVDNVEHLRHKIARYSLLSISQIEIEVMTIELCSGRSCRTYKIKSTKKVPFIRWEVCQAFIDGINNC